MYVFIVQSDQGRCIQWEIQNVDKIMILRVNNLRHQPCDMYKALTVTFVRIYDKITNSV